MNYKLGNFVVLCCLAVFLGSCSNRPESEAAASPIQPAGEDAALYQYKPGINFVVANKLSKQALAEATANPNLMVIRKHTLSNGKVFEFASVGDWVVSGDMVLGKLDEFNGYLNQEDIFVSSGRQALLPQGTFYSDLTTWPNGVLFYEASSLNQYTSTQRTAILNAMQAITSSTNLEFRTATTGNRIRFTKDSGCWSHVGMTGGAQALNLSNGCFSNGTITHEIFHAAGMMHEHQRSDRGDKIVPCSCLTEKGRNAIVPTHEAGVRSEYDYTSIMHYPRYTSDWTFTTNTSLPLFSTPGYSGPVRSSVMTARDIEAINLRYP